MAKVFSLAGKAYKLDTAADIEKYIAPLKTNDEVEEVEFNGNTLGVEACQALAEVLGTKKALRKANLADIFTGRLLDEIPRALSYLLTSLLNCPNLHTVDLSDNAFGLNTVAPLQPFLSQHVPLQHLILNNNGLGPAAGTLVAEALTQLAAKKTKVREAGSSVPDLETVVCGRNRLEAGSMAAWRAAYEANNKIKTVKMVQNGIRQEGIVTLLRDGLYHCTELEVLDLEDNTFTATGSEALAEVISSAQWGKLRELGVGDCLLGVNGGIAIGEALAQGQVKAIEILRLQNNEIDEEGLRALVDAAKAEDALCALRRVEIMGNDFDEDDGAIDELRAVLNKRREALGATSAKWDRQWGVQVDDDDDDEDEDFRGDGGDEDRDEMERKALGSRVLTEADENEAQNVARDDDGDGAVDELAQRLGKSEIK